ncbi:MULTISPECIES: YheT family hydrolase [Nitrosospira]|uniref:YheT family hydrolase n=1 Tax=Nitrosospira TaxID=35798 RepID=UPI000944EC54|nr:MULTISPECIES: alpha/beta fold hydrolase [Nitrosospira]
MKISTLPLRAKPYMAPTWLRGGHAQTIYPYLLSRPLVTYRRERWELDDGDFIDIDWLDNPADAPLVILFHGLEGDSCSHYILSMMSLLQDLGWRAGVVHFRGCSGSPNRLPRAYHAGDSMEIDWILRRISGQNKLSGSAPLYVVGVSLGGNAFLKWLGEQGQQACQLIDGAAAVSVPLDLAAAGSALASGFNLLYTRHFLDTLKRKALEKFGRFPGLFDAAAVAACTTLYQFDNLVTAPLHGFRDAEDYWHQSSSKPWLRHIQVRTLVINAFNDPFMPASVLPESHEVSSAVTLEFPEEGGHAGFLNAPFPGRLTWLPERIISFFAEQGSEVYRNSQMDLIELRSS